MCNWKPESQYQTKQESNDYCIQSFTLNAERQGHFPSGNSFLVHPNALRKGSSGYCGLYGSNSLVQQHEENSIFVHIKDHLVLYDTLWIKPKVTGRSFLKFIITTVKYCHGFIIQ